MHVFIWQGKPVDTFRNGFETACLRAGLDYFRIHDLRHAFATKFLKRSRDLLATSKLLGHKSDRMTERYRESASMRGAAFGLALALISCSVIAGTDDVPAWKKPVPGTIAILGDDGGGEATAAVCDTAAHYRAWLNYTDASGCRKFPHGLRVVLESVDYDPTKDRIPGATTALPLVRIQIPSERFAGYLELMEVHPEIPIGTIIHLERRGNSIVRLAPTQDADLDTGPDLGEQATVKVLRYDPSTGDHDLFVEVIDGTHAGQTGWVFTLDAHTDDGIPPDLFSQSVLELPQKQ